ncbi:general stress protein [Winkia neuii]|uniref:General stress protein 17M-like domain-containing protein n=1 Tax=Winkia neuii TaxID=33007 RepID=A0A2I1INT8_9ACTO|nr:general stress protein [Winkia neuii]MDK8098979.1 hypothetical protein [Winkia neuii]OFK01130.1 hypothetical protein HMPREF2835_10200 [Actinomyces sp. HMSC072A03]PKY72780.1 hypothetical protein CYJ19_03825 [Winkia neuii]
MSTPLNFTSPVGKAPAPTGTEVASFRTYAEAQTAVDALAEADYPVHTLTIVGTDLVMVERVTGRATAGKAFARGALNGLWWGVMLGLLSAFINPDFGGAVIVITAGVITLLFGLINVAVHAMAGKKRRQDYTSVTSVAASRFSVLALSDAARARQALAGAPGNQLQRQNRPLTSAPANESQREQQPQGAPAYGVRLSEEEKAERARSQGHGRHRGPEPDEEASEKPQS